MGPRVCGLLLAVLAAFGAPGAATAHDHKPPKAVLVTDTDSGEGSGYTATWASRSGRYCAVMVADGTYGWPGPPVQWLPGDAIAVRFESSHRPARVRVIGYLVGDATAGTPIFGEVDVPHQLRKVRVDGRTMWEAVLSPPPWPDLWLDVRARWDDQDGCHPQSAGWRFRAGLLPV